MGMFRQRTAFFKRFSGITIASSATTNIGFITGCRGALGILVKIWGANAATILSNIQLAASMDGVNIVGNPPAQGHAAVAFFAVGNASLTSEADPKNWALFLPFNTSDSGSNSASMGSSMGFQYPAFRLSVTTGATTQCTDEKIDVWILDPDANASAIDTMMVP